MSEQAGHVRSTAPGAGAVIVSCVFALVIAGIAGVVTTFTHAQLAPWGLIAGLAVALVLVLGLRLVFDSRVVGAAAGLGFVAGTVLLAFPAAGSPMFALTDAIGWVWALGPAVLALVAIVVPWPGTLTRRP
ncbi:hypothetical protein GCM10009840_28850 [Pseudolysinimonas kribbensis]|uniref:Histidinol dehydrogenase n=1 Tax=Pseudolysinimonas kribbensis TaxID=433641 RepID=A0ABQ6K6L8_9MICO|nr:hypothetical protein [Pseudolysinimonas kribbensis]GMA96285.1 hypothetical protein GCM10025881_31090 [Pseudolysinimonas kribbensis]